MTDLAPCVPFLSRFSSILGYHTHNCDTLDEVEESTVEGRAQRLDVLVELDGLKGALGDALWSELEFLATSQQLLHTESDHKCIPCKHPCRHHLHRIC